MGDRDDALTPFPVAELAPRKLQGRTNRWYRVAPWVSLAIWVAAWVVALIQVLPRTPVELIWPMLLIAVFTIAVVPLLVIVVMQFLVLRMLKRDSRRP